MNSSRNLFIFGFSIYAGLTIPQWVKNNTEALKTGTQRDCVFIRYSVLSDLKVR